MTKGKLSLPGEYDDLMIAQVRGFCTAPGSRRRTTVDYVLAYPMFGKSYQPGKGIMVVGRATNGWPTKLNREVHSLDPVQGVNEARALAEKDQMDWAHQWWKGGRPTFAKETDKYLIRKSSFWQVARELVADNTGVGSDDWPFHLVLL